MTDTGQILYEKNIKLRLPIASTTKIMTCLILLENSKPTDKIKMTREALAVPYANLSLFEGDTLDVYNAATAMMLYSSNEMAYAISQSTMFYQDNKKVSGVPVFLKHMNQKAKELGMNDTHYSTPHGLDTKGNYSTAYDLALLARYVIKNPYFKQIVSQKSAKINIRSNIGVPKTKKITSTFIDYLENTTGAEGIKTGKTDEAGSCFVASANHNNNRIIAVILNDKKRMAYLEAKQIINHCYFNWEYKTIISKNNTIKTKREFDFIRLIPANDVILFIPKFKPEEYYYEQISIHMKYPILKGQHIGKIDIISKGRIIDSVDLVANQTKIAPISHIIISFSILISTMILLIYYLKKRKQLCKEKTFE